MQCYMNMNRMNRIIAKKVCRRGGTDYIKCKIKIDKQCDPNRYSNHHKIVTQKQTWSKAWKQSVCSVNH